MIINTELSHDAEYIGDVQENRVGIDKSNIDFITTLLTSNLYSKPLESFFRETVSNAYDSHIEAHSEEPILILIQDTGQYKTYRISIRDYGTGVSPERFESIYRNVGSSTKRQSNDYIGMFGIGRFSCLSCADVAHITSYYEGKKYSYVMYKNGGGINIDKLSEVEGDYKNGLEVSIEKYIYSENEFFKAFRGLCLFDKLHISYKGNNSSLAIRVREFNKRTIEKFKTFSRCSILQGKNYYKVGNVIYEGDSFNLGTCDGLIIDLPIGSVDITPNREALQYTDYTNKTITTQTAKVVGELQELVNSHVNGDLTLSQFCDEFILNSSYILTINGSKLAINKDDVALDFTHLTIGKEVIPEGYIKFLNVCKYLGVDKSFVHKTHIIHRWNKRSVLNATFKDFLLDKVLLVDKADKTTKQVTFQFTVSCLLKDSVIFTYGGLDSYRKSIADYTSKDRDIELTDKQILDCVDFTFRHLTIVTMSNDNVPADFVESFKLEQRGKRKKADISEVPVREYREYGYNMSYLMNTSSTGLMVYSTHTRDDAHLKALAAIINYLPGVSSLITIKAEHLKLIENNKRFVSAENFTFLKNSALSKLVTAHLIEEKLKRICLKCNVGMSELPITREFEHKYHDYRRCLNQSLGSSFRNTLLDIVKYYENRGWVNRADIAYFSLTDSEIDGFLYWKSLDHRKNDIIKRMAMEKYGRLQKVGLT